MSIHRLNHAVLYVQDVERSAAFYRNVLGFIPLEGTEGMRGAAFLRADGSSNDHDLGLFAVGGQPVSDDGRPRVGMYHLAWEVDTLADLRDLAATLTEVGAL